MGLIIILAMVAATLWAVYLYNQLVRQKNLMKEAESGIDVQLKRRHDLIPNLIETVKGYQRHEKTTLEEVVKLRTQLQCPVPMKDRPGLESQLSRSLKTIFALAESYPDLKANQNFLDLQKNLVEIEDQIQMARRYYNGTVRDYNVAVQQFPGNIVADKFGFKPAEFFEIEYATERKTPDVKFV